MAIRGRAVWATAWQQGKEGNGACPGAMGRLGGHPRGAAGVLEGYRKRLYGVLFDCVAAYATNT